MAASVEIGTLIDSDPAIRGGRPKIAGTGLTVSVIVRCYTTGMTPEEIALEYPHINLAQGMPPWRTITPIEPRLRPTFLATKLLLMSGRNG